MATTPDIRSQETATDIGLDCHCLRCNYKWRKRTDKPKPVKCPRCTAINWDRAARAGDYTRTPKLMGREGGW